MKDLSKIKIAVSGKSGCGNSTVSRLLADKLGLKLINYTFHNMAEEAGIPFAEFCRKHNIRAVFLGAGAVGMGFPTFAVDTRDEMHRLVNRFHELGHRKIALLCGQHRHCATEFRHQGYLDALA